MTERQTHPHRETKDNAIGKTLNLLKKIARRIVRSSPMLLALWRLSKNKDLRFEIAQRFARRQRFSMVVSCYNVEDYLPDFIRSVLSLEGSLADLEVILVNDGSTDGTGAIIRRWVKRRPDLFRCVEQENQGISAARNAGLALATGDWIGFPDPDDFLSPNYLRLARKAVAGPVRDLVAINNNLIFYHEAGSRFADQHPLRYRFQRGERDVSLNKMDDYVQLSAAHAWLRRDIITRAGLTFDLRVKPGFEDVHFTGRFLLAAGQGKIRILPDAIYWYRKRAKKSSLLDGSVQHPGWFLDQIEHGVIDLMRQATRARGDVPPFLQRTALYELSWKIRHLLNHSERADILSAEEKDRFLDLMAQAMDFIETDTVLRFALAGVTEEIRIGLLARFKNTTRAAMRVYIRDFDTAKSLVQLAYVDAPGQIRPVTVLVNGTEVPPRHKSQKYSEFMGDLFFTEHRFWVPMQAGDALTVRAGDTKATLVGPRGVRIGERVSRAALRKILAPRPFDATQLDPEMRRIYAAAVSDEARDRFADCWVLMDRDNRADDNAEHLYRYLMSIGAAQNAWFALSPESPDWQRLRAEGFRLLAFDTDDFTAALVNAKYLITSHFEAHLISATSRRLLGASRFKLIFLQHGVTEKDNSGWLNAQHLTLMITSTHHEHAAIIDPQGPFILSDKEVVLTGMARHDSLLATPRTERFLTIAPTWRNSLTVAAQGQGSIRGKIADFRQTDYARHWQAVLSHPDLAQMAGRHGAQVMLCLHPNMLIYLDEFDIPDHVRIFDPQQGGSYPTVLANSALLITDYSSVAFDAAYLDRPVVYFQFDEEDFFGGAHTMRRGYFDYRRDGFGPVCTTADAVLRAAECALSGDEPAFYAQRRHQTFPHRDGSCCKRIHEAILALDLPAGVQFSVNADPHPDRGAQASSTRRAAGNLG